MARALGWLVLAAIVATADLLQEYPILGDGGEPMYLDGEGWTVSNGAGIVVGATVPGDLISDLQRANVITDPLFNLTFQGQLWDATDWTYTSPPFAAPVVGSSGEILLVFDSVKMAASVSVNGHNVGLMTDQFLRHSFPVQRWLNADQNVIQVEFYRSSSLYNNETRWMACSGGWDWAPYGTTFFNGSHTFTKGMVRSVYLVPVQQAALTAVAPAIRYTGSFPDSPLSRNTSAPFNVSVRVHFQCNVQQQAAIGKLHVTVGWSDVVTKQNVTCDGTSIAVDIALPIADQVDLWWPNELGSQHRYDISLHYYSANQPTPASPVITTSRRVGFRVLHLITADTETVPPNEERNGSGNFTMRLKVNGADVWARGANMIPMEELEARQDAQAYRALLRSAADAHFNMLRVWGGGVFLPPVFYDTCDELGIMLFHDMMYGQPWMGGTIGTPKPNAMQTAELQHNIRSLAHHPSIVVWNGGNEWQEKLTLWDEFVIPVVVAEDSTRPVWPISPSQGWTSGVDRLTGLPNGQPFKAKPFDWSVSRPIETHGPYQHGAGFKTVNGMAALNPFPANMPPTLLNVVRDFEGSGIPTGPNQPGTFATEFGCSVFSSFESMAPTLPADSWTPHAPAMVERNYPCDNIIWVYFGNQQDINTTVGSTFVMQKACYLCVVGQALEMKSDIENRRSYNSFGTLTWQLNEIWPTGGWGSVEYGTVGWTEGQVLGGRWKALHHWMSQHLYNDQIVVCGKSGACYVKNDNSLNAFEGRLHLDLIQFHDGTVQRVLDTNISLARGAGSMVWLCAGSASSPVTSCPTYTEITQSFGVTTNNSVLVATLLQGSNIVDTNEIFMETFANITASGSLPKANVQLTIDSTPKNGVYACHLTTDKVALMVQLTTSAQGRFSRNVFMLRPGTTTIHFLPSPFIPLDVDKLIRTTRVEHLAMYLKA
jgi:beta-mannosidase